MTFRETFLDLINALPDTLIYFCLFLSAFVENIFPPIPGDTITAFGAFLVGMGRLNFLGVYISTTIGSLLGFLALFRIGGYLGRSFSREKNFRFFKQEDMLRAEAWFWKYGYFLILLNRFLPGVRSVISLVGGMLRLKTSKVVILALISGAVWNLLWMLMGYALGNHWETVIARISKIMLKYNIAVLIIFVLLALFLLIRKRR